MSAPSLSKRDTTPAAATKTAAELEFISTRNKAATDPTLTNDWSTTCVSAPVMRGETTATQQRSGSVPLAAVGHATVKFCPKTKSMVDW